MINQYCGNCGRNTGHKRTIGIGTLFAALITFGLWIFLTPFYPKRCIVCGLTKSESGPTRSLFLQPLAYLWIFIVLCFVTIMFSR